MYVYRVLHFYVRKLVLKDDHFYGCYTDLHNSQHVHTETILGLMCMWWYFVHSASDIGCICTNKYLLFAGVYANQDTVAPERMNIVVSTLDWITLWMAIDGNEIIETMDSY